MTWLEDIEHRVASLKEEYAKEGPTAYVYGHAEAIQDDLVGIMIGTSCARVKVEAELLDWHTLIMFSRAKVEQKIERMKAGTERLAALQMELRGIRYSIMEALFKKVGL